MQVSSSTPNTIVLITELLADEYEVALLQGVLAVARRENVQVLCAAVGVVGDPDPERSAANFVLDLLGKHNASGILAVSSVLGGSVGAGGLQLEFLRYSGIPLCSLGVPLDGCPSVQVDNAGGAEEIVRHLIEVHGLRHIAYVRGPRGSIEAAARLSAYENVLQAADIDVDPRYVVDGDFTIPSGVAAVRTLLDERGVRLALLDAIVAANDRMALGILQELSRRGIEVPDQVAVVGFDDIPSARLAQPPLTTVEQPVEELGRRGAEMLLESLGGRPASMRPLPTRLVLRRSCGCAADTISVALSERLGNARQASFFERRPAALAEMARSASGRFHSAGRGWEERLFDALVAEVRDERRAYFNRTLEQLMTNVVRSPADANTVHEVLSVLRRHLLMYFDPPERAVLEEVVSAARVFASGYSLQLETSRRLKMAADLREFRMGLLTALSKGRDALARAATESLPPLGIDAAVVAALAAPGDVKSDAVVLFDFGSTGVPAPRRPQPLSEILSQQLDGPTKRTLLAMPIVVSGRPTGLAILSLTRFDREVLLEIQNTLLIMLVMHHGAGAAPRR